MKSMIPDHPARLNACLPHSARTGEERESLNREIVAQAKEIGSRVQDVDENDVDILVDEAVSATRG
jgi:hypothetical protein